MENHELSIGQLQVKELLGCPVGFLFGFVPDRIVVVQEVCTWMESKLIAVLPLQHFRLTNIRIIARFQGAELTHRNRGVELLRRNISGLFRNCLLELPGTLPNPIELSVRQRRITLCCFLHEDTVRCDVPAEPLDQFPGETAHGGVPAAFFDHPAAVAALAHFLIEISLFKKFIQCFRAREELRLRVFGAEEESGSVQRISICKGKQRVHFLLQCTVGSAVCGALDHHESVEPGSGAFITLRQHMVPAVMDTNRHIRKFLRQLLRLNPVFRVIGMVVVEFPGEAIALFEVGVVAVIVLVACADIIMTDCLRE